MLEIYFGKVSMKVTQRKEGGGEGLKEDIQCLRGRKPQ